MGAKGMTALSYAYQGKFKNREEVLKFLKGKAGK